MGYIDAKFKEASPETTVQNIIAALKSIDVEVYENWHDSGLENCCSLTVHAGKGFPSANGKGINKEFARASAYGEFIERLQSGLFFYKYQSFECDSEVNLQCYAPDGKYFTKEELIQNADWFECLTQRYTGLTKEALATQCEMYAHTDDGRILCVPFYSIFENKHVYLPAGFVEHIYASNGCCAGNTKEEALIHALAEIMERKSSIDAISKGEPFPEIPEEVLQSFPTVSKILAKIRECEDLDVKIFDCSIGNGFPVISTRIINKKSHGYLVNFAADPVLEIAIQRTLTEMFQARNLETIALNDYKPILDSTLSIRSSVNVLNQLETGRGLFNMDYFSEEFTCDRKATNFEDNSNLTNHQLLEKTLELYKQLELPVLIRNYDFLGFPCFMVVVPGFSESRGFRLNEPIQEYAVGDKVSQILRNPKAFNNTDISIVFMFNKMISNIVARKTNFRLLSGIPLDMSACDLLFDVTMSYLACRFGSIKTAISHIERLCDSSRISDKDKQYFKCVEQYLTLQSNGISGEKLFCILNKFNKKCFVEQLEINLSNGSPFDEYLLECDGRNCDNCRYREQCHYEYIRKMIQNAGQAYNRAKDAQKPENFITI